MFNQQTNLRAFLQAISDRLNAESSPIAAASIAGLHKACAQNLDWQAPAQDILPTKALSDCLQQTRAEELNVLSSTLLHLPWTRSMAINPDRTELTRTRAVEIIGSTGITDVAGIRCGLFLLPPSTSYPSHRHAAEELYYVLSGSARWGTDKAPPHKIAPGTSIYHSSWQWHEMITSKEPLLAIWFWTGNTDFKQYEMVD